MQTLNLDQLNFIDDKKINKILDQNEKIVLSTQVYKFNQNNKRQKRNLLLTDKNLMNLDNKSKIFKLL